jgi:hypothetical protein
MAQQVDNIVLTIRDSATIATKNVKEAVKVPVVYICGYVNECFNGWARSCSYIFVPASNAPIDDGWHIV